MVRGALTQTCPGGTLDQPETHILEIRFKVGNILSLGGLDSSEGAIASRVIGTAFWGVGVLVRYEHINMEKNNILDGSEESKGTACMKIHPVLLECRVCGGKL